MDLETAIGDEAVPPELPTELPWRTPEKPPKKAGDRLDDHIKAPPPHLLYHALRLLQLGWSVGAVAMEVDISDRTLYRWRRIYAMGEKRTDLPVKIPPAHPKKTTGRPRALAQGDRLAVFNLLLQEGWKEHLEVVRWLKENRNVQTTRSTICRVYKSEGWTRESVERIARERGAPFGNQNTSHDQAPQAPIPMPPVVPFANPHHPGSLNTTSSTPHPSHFPATIDPNLEHMFAPGPMPR
ncbi:hypothetical protein K402DRAFT_402637 [Aulographum hederae CBS 113979]|uniref:Uncharacterized protein n=1 Tax=Aulographum hederae CBS 113979 TaxID=1176131 RepID=A0A6G1H5U7_9PEZI|nr:hypothetical protein K402DRAFT_402637 [Aulographum hederae CBS 113979]